MPIQNSRQSRVTFGGRERDSRKLRIANMANTNVAFGLRPIGVVGQGYNTTGATNCRIASGNTNAITEFTRNAAFNWLY